MAAPQATVLIVDDEELNREGLARRLQRHDYEVVTARSGREAIELLGGRRFDLVLLDIMMPGMNGLEVLKFLRRVDSLVDLPIIMVTAKGESEDMVEALELGANDYITKPLDIPVVLARIRTQLTLRRAVAQVKDLEGKLDVHNKELRAATEGLAAANDRHTRDLEAAARVQRAFLPALPSKVPGAQFARALEPCSELAGDYLNVFRLGDRHAGLCALDVAGHGVAAAFLSVILSQLLARVAGEAGVVPPAEVVARLARELTPEATAGQTFSLLYGVLALDTGEFRFVSAGHPGPVHLTEGKPPAKLEVTGFPLGVGGARTRNRRSPSIPATVSSSTRTGCSGSGTRRGSTLAPAGCSRPWRRAGDFPSRTPSAGSCERSKGGAGTCPGRTTSLSCWPSDGRQRHDHPDPGSPAGRDGRRPVRPLPRGGHHHR
jgi:sigma-B regulation protein RsbU (phosphoserine phosphatase)